MATPPVTDSTSLNPALNPLSPLHLHHNDNPAVSIVIDPLFGSNFVSWSHSVRRALSVKNKLPLINGTIYIPQESEDPATYAAWVRANDLVFNWIMNSISLEIKKTIEYFSIAKAVWDKMHARYVKSDLTKVYLHKKSISDIKHENQSLVCSSTSNHTVAGAMSNINGISTQQGISCCFHSNTSHITP